jgi:hypothetical protein
MKPQALAKVYKKKLANVIWEYDTVIEDAKTTKKHNLLLELETKIDTIFSEYNEKLLRYKNGQTTREDLEVNTEI